MNFFTLIFFTVFIFYILILIKFFTNIAPHASSILDEDKAHENKKKVCGNYDKNFTFLLRYNTYISVI
jgi:hypothetical protein